MAYGLPKGKRWSPSVHRNYVFSIWTGHCLGKPRAVLRVRLVLWLYHPRISKFQWILTDLRDFLWVFWSSYPSNRFQSHYNWVLFCMHRIVASKGALCMLSSRSHQVMPMQIQSLRRSAAKGEWQGHHSMYI